MIILTIKDMARRDLFLRKLNDILEMKKAKLLEQYREINRVKQETGETTHVHDELKKYYDAMIDMKEKQDSAYSNILSHLEKLKNEQNITDEILEDVMEEQKKVERKKEDVKKQIDDIIIAENL
tara:strand:+ start:676 stop:1047 length:372 start_codon:yes stop_codon:yes gene_type:complete